MLPGMNRKPLLAAATLALLLALGAPALHAFEQPEPPSGFTPKPLVKAKRHMVVAAPQVVLTLGEPQSSGIGGGAFILSWDQAAKQLAGFDGRETAPAAATPELFLGPDGKPLPRDAAMASGLSVGTPGVLDALKLAHDKY